MYPENFTQLLIAFSKGDKNALNRLIPEIYDALHKMASRCMQHQYSRNTMNTTGLVHEAYLKLVDQQSVDWHSRAHFFNVAGQVMRQILVDHARKRQAVKRGGDIIKLSIDKVAVVAEERSDEWLAVDEALKKLSTIDQRQSKIVELRYFVGLTIDETSRLMSISPATVKREWIMARAWLIRELKLSGNCQYNSVA